MIGEPAAPPLLDLGFGLSIRPDPTSRESVILSDAWNRRRFRIHRRDLVRLLAPDEAHGGIDPIIHDVGTPANTQGGAITPVDQDRLRHWHERGWHPSLEYYLWSREIPYADLADTSGQKRQETLAAYLDESDPPLRIRPSGSAVPLGPSREPLPAMRVGDALTRRRTIRRYAPGSAELRDLSMILRRGLDPVRRARARSQQPGALNQLRSHGVAFDFYLVVYEVAGLVPGVYFYPLNEELLLVREGEFRDPMCEYLQRQPGPMSAAWTIVLCADLAQYMWLYRHERALRNLYIEAGRIGQYLVIAGVAAGIGTLPTPAQNDGGVSEILGLVPRRQIPVYTLTMGLHRGFLNG